MMRPVLSREEYLKLRNSAQQIATMRAIREGNTEQKRRLIQMNYSCMPNEDGTLKGSETPSNTVGMDIDHVQSAMEIVKERILAKKEELGLMMLEESARGEGYHLVFRRRPELSQVENLQWASEVLGVEFDAGAKDITRVFFTTGVEDLIFLKDEIFSNEASPLVTTKRPSDYETQAALATKTDSATGSSPLSKSFCPSGNEGTGGELAGGESFKGIPYSEIIAEYWKRTGGEPEMGERNVKLHKLAVNLRTICDNSREVLMQVMPRYGLSEEEMKQIVESACKEQPKGISKVIAPLLSTLQGEDSSSGLSSPLQGESVGAEVRVSLPLGLKESLVGVPKPMQMPVLCAVMPIAATYADQVEVEYCDGTRMRLGLMSIIRGEQASGKSVCKSAVDMWKRQLEEEDALARKREEEWKEKKKARKANEKAPDDPKVLIRTVPVTVSCSTLLKRMKNSRGHTLYSFGEELDTLRKTNGAGSWSSKYDIYRLAFDQGEWGQDYNSDQAESGVVRVAYNWTMLGTNGAMKKCFKQDNIENGLSSRILVSEMPDASFQKMPKYGKRSDLDEQRIQEAVSRLRSYTGFIDTPRLRRAIEQWVEEKRVEAAKDIDRVKDTYRKRAAVIGFRCGVIHALLAQKDEQVFKESLSSVRFATMMAQYCLDEQLTAFGEALEKEYVTAQAECRRYGANHSVFDQLPPVFTLDDLAGLKRSDLSRKSIQRIVSRWKCDGWVEQADRLHWKKVSKSDK